MALYLIFITRKVLIKECKKRYIIIDYYYNSFFKKIKVNNLNYNLILKYHRVVVKLYQPYFKTQKQPPAIFYKVYKVIILNLPNILLILLIIFDCFLHSFQLIFVSYYMPFFILYRLYHDFDEFIWHTEDNILNKILYERYYMKHYFRYIDLATDEELYLQHYLSKGLQKGIEDDISIIETLWLVRRCKRINKLHWTNGIDTWENTEYEKEQLKGPESNLEIPEPKKFQSEDTNCPEK